MNQNSPNQNTPPKSKMNCCTSRKQLSAVQRENKFWRERYFIEKKCRSAINNWIFGVFGFVVKVECDRQTNLIKIEGREPKDLRNHTAIQLPYNEEERFLFMEDRFHNSDFEPDPDELAALSLALVSSDDDTDHLSDLNNSNSFKSQQSDKDKDKDTVSQAAAPPQLPEQNENFQVEVAGNENISAEGPDILYLSNFDESSGNNGYFLVKSSEDANPQQEYAFAQGDFDTMEISSQQQQVFYRLGSPTDSLTPVTTSPSKLVSSPSPAKNTNGSSPSIQNKRKKSQDTKTSTSKSITDSKSPKLTSNSKASTTTNNKRSTLEKPSSYANEDSSEKVEKPAEFEITLREKAEIYVRTKAKNAIEKSGSGFACSLCKNNYSYSSLDNAIAHTKSHFENKPYKCDHCPLTFAIQKGLLSHRKQIHSKNNRGTGTSLNTPPTNTSNSTKTKTKPKPPLKRKVETSPQAQTSFPVSFSTSNSSSTPGSTSSPITARLFTVNGRTMLEIQQPQETPD